MSEEEARKIVIKRLEHQPDVQFAPEAIEAAVFKLMGLEPPPEPVEVVEKVKPSPLIAHTHGLHEKYFPDA